MDVENFINEHFSVVEDEQQERWVVWDDTCRTMYPYFKDFMFGGIIQEGIDQNRPYNEIVKSMIMRSITENYGLTEYIIRYTGISLF